MWFLQTPNGLLLCNYQSQLLSLLALWCGPIIISVISNTATDQGPTSARTASHVAPANSKPAEDVGNHVQGKPGTALRTAMEKG